MKLPRFSSREQLLALIAVVVVSVWAIVSIFAVPLSRKLTALESRAGLSRQKLQRLSGLADRKGRIEDAYQQYAGFRSAEPEERLQGMFLEELERFATDTSLSLNLKPRPIQRDGSAAIRLRVEVDAEATQTALMAFLDRVLIGPSLMDIEQLRFSATATPSRPLRATMLVTKTVTRP